MTNQSPDFVERDQARIREQLFRKRQRELVPCRFETPDPPTYAVWIWPWLAAGIIGLALSVVW